jgi:hypothetical protein
MNWMNILKYTEDISENISELSNAAIAEELSDEDVKIEWVEQPQGVQRKLPDNFKITMIHRGEELSSITVSSHRRLTQVIQKYKRFLKVDAHIRETFGENGVGILGQDYRIGKSENEPRIYYKLYKPKWAAGEPHSVEESFVEIHVGFYNYNNIYVGSDTNHDVLIENVDNLDLSMATFYANIGIELSRTFLRKCWKSIIKISRTERDIARGSDVWQEEIKSLQKDAEEEWKGKITWDGDSGYLGNKKVKVLDIDKNNLSIEKTFPDISNDIVESIYNSLINYMHIEDNMVFMDIFDSRWRAEEIFNVFGNNPDKLKKLEDFSNSFKESNIDPQKIEFDFSLDSFKISYRIKKQMSAQSTDWKLFTSFKKLEKDVEEAYAPEVRAEILVEQVIADSPNINKFSFVKMREVVGKIDSKISRNNIKDYLLTGDKNSWVQVVTDMDNVYYVNTKTAAITGSICRLMIFTNESRLCVETHNKNIPYGDQVVSLLRSLSNESIIRERGQWERFSQEI